MADLVEPEYEEAIDVLTASKTYSEIEAIVAQQCPIPPPETPEANIRRLCFAIALVETRFHSGDYYDDDRNVHFKKLYDIIFQPMTVPYQFGSNKYNEVATEDEFELARILAGAFLDPDSSFITMITPLVTGPETLIRKLVVIETMIRFLEDTYKEYKDPRRNLGPVGKRQKKNGSEVIEPVFSRVFNAPQCLFQYGQYDEKNGQYVGSDENINEIVNNSTFSGGPTRLQIEPESITMTHLITEEIGGKTPPIIYVLATTNGAGHATIIIQLGLATFNVGLVADIDEGALAHLPDPHRFAASTPGQAAALLPHRDGQIIFASPDPIYPTEQQGSKIISIALLTNDMVTNMNKFLGRCTQIRDIRHNGVGETNVTSIQLDYPPEEARYFLLAHLFPGSTSMNCMSWALNISGSTILCKQPSSCPAIDTELFMRLQQEISKSPSDYTAAVAHYIPQLQKKQGLMAKALGITLRGVGKVVGKTFGFGGKSRKRRKTKRKQTRYKK